MLAIYILGDWEATSPTPVARLVSPAATPTARGGKPSALPCLGVLTLCGVRGDQLASRAWADERGEAHVYALAEQVRHWTPIAVWGLEIADLRNGRCDRLRDGARQLGAEGWE